MATVEGLQEKTAPLHLQARGKRTGRVNKPEQHGHGPREEGNSDIAPHNGKRVERLCCAKR